MTWFTLIMIVMVVSVIACLLFTTRYLFSGRSLRRVRIVMLLFDAIGMGWFIGRAIIYHLISGPSLIIETVIVGFMTQLICTAFVLVAVIVRFFWRRMMAVPVDESRRRLLRHAAVYPAVAAGLSIYGGFWEREATVERNFTIPVKGLGAGGGTASRRSATSISAASFPSLNSIPCCVALPPQSPICSPSPVTSLTM